MSKSNSNKEDWRKSTKRSFRVNNEITAKQVRLVYKENEETKSENDFSEVMDISSARTISQQKELDLVEINSQTTPPIVRLVNYEKYLWNLKKKEKSKSKTIQLKEVQLTANIAHHDIETKARKAADFIKNGDKVKVVLTLRSRQLSRRDESKKSLYLFLDVLADAIPIAYDVPPKDEGNRCIAVVRIKK